MSAQASTRSDFWSAIDRVTPAFGYGLLVTPLQLAHAYAVFANDGRMVPLTLLAQTSQDNDHSASGGRQIISRGGRESCYGSAPGNRSLRVQLSVPRFQASMLEVRPARFTR